MDMTDTRYYPLASVDSGGNKQVPMFAVTDLKMMQGEISLYLSEITPQHFRLHSRKPMTQKATDSLEIRCPRCGEPMKQIGRQLSFNELGLYSCPCCNRNK